MAEFRKASADAIEQLCDPEKTDACDSRRVLTLQLLIGRTDDFQNCVEDLLKQMRGQEEVQEDENAEAGTIDD